LVKRLDRSSTALAIIQREELFRKLKQFLKPSELLCIPTAPSPAPLKGSLNINRREGIYYHKALSLTSIAGIGRLPQISMPLSTVLVKEGPAPIGLSLLGGFHLAALL
jgi:amidase